MSCNEFADRIERHLREIGQGETIPTDGLDRWVAQAWTEEEATDEEAVSEWGQAWLEQVQDFDRGD